MASSNTNDGFYVVLRDDQIDLIPLTKEHITDMSKLSSDVDIWTWYTENLFDPDDLESWMNKRLEESKESLKMTYAVILRTSKEVVGSTSFGHIDWQEKCIEIGWTWLGKQYIGTGINKRMKYLMLCHAFDVMKIERLELRTDERNIRSRKAMEKIGAKHDGTLRSHRMTQGGRRRNTVVYSILREEWPLIKYSIFKEFHKLNK